MTPLPDAPPVAAPPVTAPPVTSSLGLDARGGTGDAVGHIRAVLAARSHFGGWAQLKELIGILEK